jgi:hypothetical protein
MRRRPWVHIETRLTALELLRRRAFEYELLAEWHVERSAGDPRYGDAADALVAIAIVLREVAEAFDDDELLERTWKSG